MTRSRGGVALRRGAASFVGNASVATRPATIDWARVAAATPEGREMVRDGVAPESARHRLLVERMWRRVLEACGQVARGSGLDLMVRSEDLLDARGLPVADATADVLAELAAAR